MAEQTNENPLTKFDAPTLKSIGASPASGSLVFQPRNMAEAMELSKLMASSNFVPPHLRGKAGDCLAVVMFASRVEMDPYAVASKSYFVNDRMAFEAQFIAALVNTRAPLVGRLEVEWAGENNTLICTVTGTLRGDYRPKVVRQEIATITTRNSPLWKQSPRQQLGYYTLRLWARLHCPEVLLGVYAQDEIADGVTLEADAAGVHAPIPPRPTRADFEPKPTATMTEAEAEAGERAMDAGYAATVSGRMPDDPPPHDEDGVVADEPAPAAAQWSVEAMPIPGMPKPKPADVLTWARALGEHVKAADTLGELKLFLKNNDDHIVWFRQRYGEPYDALRDIIDEKLAALAP